jgi:ribosomal protein S19
MILIYKKKLFSLKSRKNLSIYKTKPVKKVPFVSYYLLKLPFRKKRRQQFVLNRPILIYRKNNFFLPVFIYYKFLIHIGRFKKMFIGSRKSIFYKFGEYFFTRRFGRGDVIHQRKKKKKKGKK